MAEIGGGPMRNVIKASMVAIALALASPLAAQDFDAGIEAGQRGDYVAALSEFRPLAAEGHAEAQFYLGYMYGKGQGVAQDYGEAANWYRKAAEQGFAKAQLFLGFMYAEGQGVPQDNVPAHLWFNLAARQGYEDATKYRSWVAQRMTPEQISEAQELAGEWPNKSSSETIESAAAGAPQDTGGATDTAPDLEAGVAAYRRGDYAAALSELRPLAEQGQANAQLALGVMYTNGEGVAQNYIQAHMWLNLAASQGEKGAISYRDRVASIMTAEPIAEAEKLAREWRPKLESGRQN